MKISLFCRLVAAITVVLLFPVQLTADVLVDIDITTSDIGELPSIANDGTLGGTFDAEKDTPASVTEVDGVKAITLQEDWYVGPAATPLAGDADRSLEAWVHNPAIATEETIVAWGRRGGPDASNWSMLYGNHNTWGALGGWGGSADMPFVPGGGAPAAGEWHHLALIYDSASNTRSIYVDGALSNSENDGPALNTH
ncbi:MAG: LamG-like jellyroll fold domain-containing protein, partial [Verrucomicrobiales bacterium]